MVRLRESRSSGYGTHREGKLKEGGEGHIGNSRVVRGSSWGREACELELGVKGQGLV